jgi:hypothetical protein
MRVLLAEAIGNEWHGVVSSSRLRGRQFQATPETAMPSQSWLGRLAGNVNRPAIFAQFSVARLTASVRISFDGHFETTYTRDRLSLTCATKRDFS